jgi:hypothetical protein
MEINKLRNFALAGIATTVMLGCGGSGDSGTTAGSTGITTVGAITGFGSVYVNGVKYETDQAEYEVEDEAAFDDSTLKTGMVVKVKGSVNPDGRTGTANQIIYEDEIQGPVQDVPAVRTDPMEITIFGVPITVSSTDTFFDNGLSFSSLQNGDNVEVSGYFNGQSLQATYVKKENDNDVEIKGTVSNSNDIDQFILTTFFGAEITVTLDLTAVPTPIIPQNDQYVEVEGTPTGPTSVNAFKVELEDRHHLDDDEGEVEIRGVLSNDGSNWFLNDMPVTLSGDIEYEPEELEDAINNLPPEGMMVKVEGDYRNGVLVIDEIEDKQDTLEFKGTVANLVPTGAKSGTLTIAFGAASGTVSVILDSNTMYSGDDSLQQFDLQTDVPSDAYVEVKAMQDPTGQILATRLEIEDSPQEFEVEGPLDNYVAGNSITAMSVTFGVDGSTVFLPRQPVAGDSVDITDVNGDGIADQVEIED